MILHFLCSIYYHRYVNVNKTECAPYLYGNWWSQITQNEWRGIDMFNMLRFVEYHVLQVDNFEQKQPKHMGCIWYLTTRDTFRPPVRITECGHSYCEACLLQIRGPHTLAVRQQRLAFHGQNFIAPQSYSCPECRKPQFKEVEDLTRNYFAERAVENFTSTKIKEPKDDEMCKLHNMPLILSEFRWSLDVKTIPYRLVGILWYI